MELQKINIASNSKNGIEAWLSNLSYNSFEFNWVKYDSIEAFWQSLKFEEWSIEWQECIRLSWVESKIYWNNAEQESSFIYNWCEYQVWSTEHKNLMKEALREQLKQNKNKLDLLLSTWNINLIHRPQRKDWTCYPDSITISWDTFSSFLMELREEFIDIESWSWKIKDELVSIL